MERKVCDSRGGWNRYKFDINFFKKWSNEMAYVLGFLYADGDIIDSDLSSRTRYIKFSNKDKEIIEKIKSILKAEHPIHFKPPCLLLYPNNKSYKNSKRFYLKIGSKELFGDLIKLGLVPNKSKTMKFPLIPIQYLNHFIRGYFDGDGTISIEKRKNSKQNVIFGKAETIFSSGSKRFLKTLSEVLARVINVRKAPVYIGERSFQIKYFTKDSVELFKFMYRKAGGLFLKRKFNVYEKFLKRKTRWLDKEVVQILNENRKRLATYPRS